MAYKWSPAKPLKQLADMQENKWFISKGNNALNELVLFRAQCKSELDLLKRRRQQEAQRVAEQRQRTEAEQEQRNFAGDAPEFEEVMRHARLKTSSDAQDAPAAEAARRKQMQSELESYKMVMSELEEYKGMAKDLTGLADKEKNRRLRAEQELREYKQSVNRVLPGYNAGRGSARSARGSARDVSARSRASGRLSSARSSGRLQMSPKGSARGSARRPDQMSRDEILARKAALQQQLKDLEELVRIEQFASNGAGFQKKQSRTSDSTGGGQGLSGAQFERYMS